MMRRLHVFAFLLREFRLYVKEDDTRGVGFVLFSLVPLSLIVKLVKAPGVPTSIYAMF